MNIFKESTLRLKQELHVTQDKEVAALLGLSPRAWAGRKERGVFPDKELLSLMQKRPELNLDFDYVTTGIRAAVYDGFAKEGQPEHYAEPSKIGDLADLISVNEHNILHAYRTADDSGKQALISVAKLINGKGK